MGSLSAAYLFVQGMLAIARVMDSHFALRFGLRQRDDLLAHGQGERQAI